jgi:hypothetical protein
LRKAVSFVVASALVLLLLLAAMAALLNVGTSLNELLRARERATYVNALKAQERLGLYYQPPYLLVRNEGGTDVTVVKLLLGEGGLIRLQDVNFTLPPGGSERLPYSGGRISLLTSLGNLFTYYPSQAAQSLASPSSAKLVLRSPNGRYLALAGSGVALYELREGRGLYSLALPGEASFGQLQDDGTLLLALGGIGLSLDPSGAVRYVVSGDVRWGLRSFSGRDLWLTREQLLVYEWNRPSYSLALQPYDRPMALGNDYFALCRGGLLMLYAYSPLRLHRIVQGQGYPCSYAAPPVPMVENLSSPLVLFGANYSAPPQLYPAFISILDTASGALLKIANSKSLSPLLMGDVQLLLGGSYYLLKERGFIYEVDSSLSGYRLIYEAPRAEPLELEALQPQETLLLRQGPYHIALTLSPSQERELTAPVASYSLPAYYSESYSFNLFDLGWDGRSALRVVMPAQLHSYTLFAPRLGYDWGRDDGFIYRKTDAYPGYPWMPLPPGSDTSILNPLEVLDASLGAAMWAPNYTIPAFAPRIFSGLYRLEAYAPLGEGGTLFFPVNRTLLLRVNDTGYSFMPWPRFLLSRTYFSPHVTGFDGSMDGWSEQAYAAKCGFDSSVGLPPPSRLCTALQGSSALTLYLTRRLAPPFWPFMLELYLFYQVRNALQPGARVINLSASLIDEATGRGCARTTLVSEQGGQQAGWIRTPGAVLPSYVAGYCYRPSTYRLVIMVAVLCSAGCWPSLWLDNVSFSYFPMEATPFSMLDPGMHLSPYNQYSWSGYFAAQAQAPLAPYSFCCWRGLLGSWSLSLPMLSLNLSSSDVALAVYRFLP